jgi:negative regulator of sigma E activity
MANPSHEQLSALADDELERGEAQLLLRRYANDGDMRFQWVAYHVIGEAVRRGRPSTQACGIVERVGETLDCLNAPSAGPSRTRHRHRYRGAILKTGGAAAVAAVVAVVAVILVRQPGAGDVSMSAPTAVVPPRSPASDANRLSATSSVRWNQGSAEVRHELNEYLLDHNENVPALSRQGMLPYVHLASFVGTGKPPVSPRHERRQDGGR